MTNGIIFTVVESFDGVYEAQAAEECIEMLSEAINSLQDAYQM